MIPVMKFAAGVTTLALTVALQAAPVMACYPTVTIAQVDQALASSRLQGARLADASALRDYLAEAIQRSDQRSAHHLEKQAMTLMGYVEDPPVARGGCGRTWSKRG